MKETLPFQVNVSSMYGAPMGRYSAPATELSGRVHLRYVPFVSGDYDQGGAYWGGGQYTQPLFCAWDDEGTAVYLRAASRKSAKWQLSSKNPTIKFYR
jgi:hypothetical protein